MLRHTLALVSNTHTETVEPEGPTTDEEVAGLDAKTRERRDAALAEVRTFGDPVLKSRAAPVTEFDAALAREAGHMVRIMRDALGVGLAATQLGVMHRLLVFAAGPDATPTALANPEVEWLSVDEDVAEEGCLSLPGIVVEVGRPTFARVSGQDVTGAPVLIEASGLEARVIQHELDHLDGVLILDRTERSQRRAALRALRDGTTYSPSAPEGEGEDGAAEE
jgi:peptide deformylase